MLKSNERISLSGDDAIEILSEVEYMLISLRDIARYHFQNNAELDMQSQIAYQRDTCSFIDDNNITHRLAKIRKIISEKFDDSLGDDDMDDIEREMEKIVCWKPAV